MDILGDVGDQLTSISTFICSSIPRRFFIIKFGKMEKQELTCHYYNSQYRSIYSLFVLTTA